MQAITIQAPQGLKGKTVEIRRGPAAVIGDDPGSKPLGGANLLGRRRQ